MNRSGIRCSVNHSHMDSGIGENCDVILHLDGLELVVSMKSKSGARERGLVVNNPLAPWFGFDYQNI